MYGIRPRRVGWRIRSLRLPELPRFFCAAVLLDRNRLEAVSVVGVGRLMHSDLGDYTLFTHPA